jgi:aspartyl-tRNA(Asn)/glutamyl-tRNA(Gln) amidotransferase subunit A
MSEAEAAGRWMEAKLSLLGAMPDNDLERLRDLAVVYEQLTARIGREVAGVPERETAPLVTGGSVVSGSVAPAASHHVPTAQIDAADARIRSLVEASAEDSTNAFITLRRPSERPLSAVGPLTGQVVAVKDNIHVSGMPTSSGSRLGPARPADASARVVTALERHGAYVSGKLNMGELALDALSDNPHFGRVRNPWAPDRSPGGSSGGCGAAIAAGLADIAIGSDSAGSVRIPAAMCGVVGYRPSPGVVSLDGLVAPAWSIDSIGLLTRTVDDLCRVASSALGVTAHETPTRTTGVIDDSLGGIDSEVRQVFVAAVNRLSPAVLSLSHVSAESLTLAPAVAAIIAYSEVATQLADEVKQRPQDIGVPPRDLLRLGLLFSASDYLNARRMCAVLLSRFLQALGEADVMITPTLPVVAPRFGDPVTVSDSPSSLDLFTLIQFTAIANVAGLPAISVPVGLTASGLPVGLQVLGRPGADSHVLACARAIEATLEPLGLPHIKSAARREHLR